AAPAQAADYDIKTLHFDVTTGPANDQHCDVVGDLYKPTTATAANPAPAILTTNGFGGSKDDQADLAKLAASRGYVVLSYSGLGFGGSGCKITLDDRDYDGKAGSQLVTFLGGGKAAKDGTKVDYVRKDEVGSDGKHHQFDPRIGMIGGSYGGQIQFAVAGIDPRVDTIIPIITWNDLSYSLAPNNTSFDHGVTYQTPGIEKFEWTSLFFGLGIADGFMGAQADPARNVGCPNFDDRACGSKVQMDATGAPNDATLLFSRHASVESFVDQIRIPTLLAQGQADTLFNIQEAIATYRSLKAQNVPVKMIWQSWGHSGGDSVATGEMGVKEPANNYETRTFLQWFDHYLGGVSPAPKLDVTYWRDWIQYKGDATPAYGEAPAYPFGSQQRLFLSGSDALVGDQNSVQAGSAAFTTPAAGAPTSYTETSALDQDQPVTDAPGTFAEFTGPPLANDLDVVGVPTADVNFSAPTFASGASAAGAPGLLTLFFKLYDLKPDGTIVLAHRLIAPVRIADYTHPLHVELPGIVHRFPKGDRIALTIAASDAAYRGTNVVGPVTISTDKTNPGVLTLPFVPAAQQGAVAPSTLRSGLPGTQPKPRCEDRRRFTFKIHQPKHGRVTKVVAYVNGKRVKTVKGHRITKFQLARLPIGIFRVKIVAFTSRNTRTISVRTYRGCKKGKPHTHVVRG
ncbi:MAG TPA: CocE/NonD family hydrolase, partial [Thermoleophilaceae bacterium]